MYTSILYTHTRIYIYIYIVYNPMYCYVQEFDKIIGTHVKFKESLFNMELVLLWP